jgi:hypothetical protein
MTGAETRRLLDSILPITTLAAFLWVVRFLLPRAARQEDRFALVCTLLTLILAGLLRFFVGVPEVY